MFTLPRGVIGAKFSGFLVPITVGGEAVTNDFLAES
jgi:hypothetical protein